jgi:hypothetical protein
MGEVTVYDATVTIRHVIKKVMEGRDLTEHEEKTFPLNSVLGVSGVAFQCKGKYFNNAGDEVTAEGEMVEQPPEPEEVAEPVETEPVTGAAEKNPLACELCPFVAKSLSGLKSHERKHARDFGIDA